MEAPRGSPSGCGRNLRCAEPSPQPLRAAQNFAHTAVNAARLAASPAPRSALGRPSAAAAAGLRLRTFPRCFRLPPRGLPRGCGSSAPALRWAGWRCGRYLSVHHLARPGGVLPRPAHPEPPTPERASATPSLTFPARRRGPHSPLSPLDSSSGCSRRGRGVSAFVPWGWQVRLGPGRAGNAAKVGIPDGVAHSQQLCRQQ